MFTTYKNKLLLLAIILQLGILLAMYVQAQYPLYNGTEVVVAVKPVDPRSLFRGNYARLSYNISSVNIDPKLAVLPQTNKPNPRIFYNVVVYTTLKKTSSGIYEAQEMLLDKPSSGLFLRGRLHSHTKLTQAQPKATIKYGIEAFFAPKKRALEIEASTSWLANTKADQPPALVTLMISKSGRAAIKHLEVLHP